MTTTRQAERKRRLMRERYRKNPEKYRKQRKQYWADNKDRFKGVYAEYRRQWRQKNKARIKMVDAVWRARNRKKWNAIQKAWKDAHPGYYKESEKRRWRKNKASLVEKHQAWKRKNPERWRLLNRRSDLKKKYGMTLERYAAMLAAQHGKCALCGIKESALTGKSLCVDHDHSTGKVRALLCNRCNVGIALIGDDSRRLIAAAHYVDFYRAAHRQAA